MVLYEALTGVAPFDGDNVNAIMYATVNTTPPPPSQHNRAVPAMLDLIVAKAMAKLLEDRYQSGEGTRRRPARGPPPDGLHAPGRGAQGHHLAAMPRNAAPIAVPSATWTPPRMPMGAGAQGREEGRGQAAPVPLAKTFDSFDATLRLAAMTDQTEDFRDYISATQKMRAYKGKIEPDQPARAAGRPPKPRRRRAAAAPPRRGSPRLPRPRRPPRAHRAGRPRACPASTRPAPPRT